METKVGWGLSGCGDISEKRVAPAIKDSELCRFVGVTRKNYKKAENFAERHKAKKWYRDFNGLIEDEEIDAVYIATPVYLHMSQTIAAAEAGKHVLCEKPMALNSRDCRSMIDACRANGVKLGVAYYRRFYPAILKIKELIDSGSLGKPVVVSAYAHEFWDRDDLKDWRIVPELGGGGPLMDFGSHRLDIFYFLMGEVERIAGLTDTLFFERDVEDTATLVLKFTNGTHGILNVSHAVLKPADTFTVMGTEGTVEASVLNSGILTITRGDTVETLKLPPAENLHKPLIDDFSLAVLENREPLVTGETGYYTSRIIERAYQSVLEKF